MHTADVEVDDVDDVHDDVDDVDSSFFTVSCCALQAIWTCGSDPRRAGKHKWLCMCAGHHRNGFDDLSTKYGHVLFGNSLRIEFVACWDSLQNWSRIIDFRNGSGDSNIYIANKGTTNTFVFSVRNGTTWSAIELTNFINIGATSRYLCVVTPEGLMSVYRDDLLVGEASKARGVSPGCR